MQSASLVLCYSRMTFVQLYPSFTRFICNLFLTDAIEYFGGAASVCMVDNTHVIVLSGTSREMVPVAEMESFGDRFGFQFVAHEMGDANRSARVEGPFQTIEDNFQDALRRAPEPDPPSVPHDPNQRSVPPGAPRMTRKSESSRGARPPIVPERVRRIGAGGFAFVPNRFLHGGFFAALTQNERSLYLLLILAADRNGVSFYRYDSICSILEVSLDDFIAARNGPIAKDLIIFDGTRFQVLELPAAPVFKSHALATGNDLEHHDPETIRAAILRALDPK